MTTNLITALFIFALVATATPGPNNVMVLASGANFGYRRTLPHLLGITVGFTLMIALVGLGIVRIFDAWPPSFVILSLLCAGYLLYLAWRLAHAAPVGAAQTGARPFTFLQAAAFQWVNPKAWAMGVSAVTIHAPDRSIWSVLIVAGMFGLVSLPCVSVWVLMGQQIRRLLSSPRRLRAFNLTMAALLLLSLAPALFH